ncbi:hypothetical protein C3942_16850 [Solimonas fluminis]|uniref:Uncharacterized protein n=1 Tax=Solimonas fluminis TaxID=2086571 RepID=A0A2S5TCX0_9GAMM|nr:hypothetical protein [Solimonas fluminis]PPE72717.1 hypothetical protein C3942_16850 [Solimonas fluminis]
MNHPQPRTESRELARLIQAQRLDMQRDAFNGIGTSLANTARLYATSGYTQKLKPGFMPDSPFQPWAQHALDRFNEADRFIATYAKDSYENFAEVERCEEELVDTLAERENRRRIEHDLALRIESAARNPAVDRGVASLMDLHAQRAKMCRTEGVWGVNGEGDKVIAWNFKCGSTKLCPDGSRENTRRVAELYTPEIIRWHRSQRGRRLFYCVFTLPNFDTGSLAVGNKVIQQRFRDFLGTVRPIRDVERATFGYGPRKRSIKHWQPAKRLKSLPDEHGKRHVLPYEGPGIHGALTQLECPVSARGDWNVHLNALLLVQDGEGFDFDYATVRDMWGANVHIEAVEPDERGLIGTIQELIKYPARMIAEKSADKAADGSTAPPMMAWTDTQLAEWFGSTVKRITDKNGVERWIGTRWMASYGCLYGLTEPEDTDEEQPIQWMGRIAFTDAGRYWVGSTRENNFSRSEKVQTASERAFQPVKGYRLPQIEGPPGWTVKITEGKTARTCRAAEKLKPPPA